MTRSVVQSFTSIILKKTKLLPINDQISNLCKKQLDFEVQVIRGSNNVTIRRTTKPMNDITSSLDLSLLGDTLCTQDEEKTPIFTQTELTLKNLSELITLRLKENNSSIITELQNTIQIELNKAISKFRDDFELETISLVKQNVQRIMDIQFVNSEIESLKIENKTLKSEIEKLKMRTNACQTYCTESH